MKLDESKRAALARLVMDVEGWAALKELMRNHVEKVREELCNVNPVNEKAVTVMHRVYVATAAFYADVLKDVEAETQILEQSPRMLPDSTETLFQ